MRTERKYQLHRVASKDELRGPLQCVLIEGDRATATNGWAIASVPVEKNGKEPERMLVTTYNWRSVIKGIPLVEDVSDKEEFKQEYPDWRQVVRDSKAQHEKKNQRVVTLHIDTKRLFDLAKSLDTECVVLKIPVDRKNKCEKAIHVFPIERYSAYGDPAITESFGVIMPMRQDRIDGEHEIPDDI